MSITARHARAFTAAAVIAGIFTLSGCSGSEPESTAPTQASSPNVTSPAPSPSASETAEPVSEANGALDDYVALELAQKDQILSLYEGVYSDFTVEAVYPDTVVYSYTYMEAIDSDAAAEFDSIVSMLDETCKSVVFPAMEQVGVAPTQKATFVYLNPDGSEIWSHTVSSEDV